MDSFVAWNGLSYAGRPPQDWYLAQDARWWPAEIPSDAGSIPLQQWQIGEGSREGRLELSNQGLQCVINRDGIEERHFIAFESVLRVSRTRNTFGSEGVRIQTTSQTFEWSIEQGRDGLVELINQYTGPSESAAASAELTGHPTRPG